MTRKIQRWTYSAAPGSSPIDAVRFLVGDTDPDDKQMDDCEIEFLLDQNGGPLNAAICAALGLAAIYSREVTDRNQGDRGSLSQHYIDLASELQKKRARRAVAAYAGGLSHAEKGAQEANTDRVAPEFTRDMMKAWCSNLGILWPGSF